MAGGAIPVPHPAPSQGPYIELILKAGPTHGQMKGKSSTLMRFPEIGSRKGPRMTQNDPESTLKTTLQTGPEMASDGPEIDPQIS